MNAEHTPKESEKTPTEKPKVNSAVSPVTGQSADKTNEQKPAPRTTQAMKDKSVQK